MQNPYFNLVRAVWHYGRNWRGALAVVYITSAIGQVFLGFTPYAFGRVIDLLQHYKAEDFSAVVWWLLAGIALIFLFWVFHGPSRVLERRVALRIWREMWLNIYEKLTWLPLKWHQDHHSGNTVSRINRAGDSLFSFAGEQFIYIQTIIKFFVSVAFLAWLSPAVGAVSLVCCSAIFAVVLAFDRKLIPIYDKQNEKWNETFAMFYDYVSNMTTVLTLRLGGQTRDTLRAKTLYVDPFYRRDVTLNEIKWFVMNMLLAGMQAAILISYVVLMPKNGDVVMLGTLVMVYKYQLDIQDVFFTLALHYSELVRKDTNVKGLKPILDDIEKLTHAPPAEQSLRNWREMKVRGLSFHHDKKLADDKPTRGQIFNGLNFDLKRGEKIALIGGSGGGKSTLLNLLRGLYMADHVRLTVDGHDFDNLEPLHVVTTLIPQDPEIFENTISFNVTMDLPASDEAIGEAMRLSAFAPVLQTLPEGLKTDIREKGLNLSVGQKQRLAMARGLFAAENSSVILMDEPTSSVDLPTERAILTETLGHFPDATMIVSLHRLHLLPLFDRVIFLEQGTITADGAVQDLLDRAGPVRDLWQAYQQGEKEA